MEAGWILSIIETLFNVVAVIFVILSIMINVILLIVVFTIMVLVITGHFYDIIFVKFKMINCYV